MALAIAAASLSCGPGRPPLAIRSASSTKHLVLRDLPEKVTIELSPRNESSSPIRLLLASKACSCTSLRLPSEPVPPGSSTTILLDYARPGAGCLFAYDFALRTDSGSEPVRCLGQTTVLDDVSVDCDCLAFDFGAEAALLRTATVSERYGNEAVPRTPRPPIVEGLPPEIHPDSADAPRVVSLGEEVKELQWQLRFRAERAKGAVGAGELVVRSANFVGTPSRIGWRLSESTGVVVQPRVLRGSRTAAGRRLVLRACDGLPFVVSSIVAEGAQIAVRPLNRSPAVLQMVELTVQCEKLDGGRLVLQTTHPTSARIEVPLEGG